jgi:hypothetical protein
MDLTKQGLNEQLLVSPCMTIPREMIDGTARYT